MRKTNNKTPYIIGITGSLGTGKSLVGEILSKCTVLVIDTDFIVRDILRAKNPISKSIVSEFGQNILSSNSNEYVDRKILGSIVFKDESKRKTLESIIHPEVIKILKKKITQNSEKAIIAVLVPLLFESNLEKMFDEIWCVICDETIQMKRLQDKGFLLEDAKRRIKAQLSPNEKAKLSDYVINNSGTILETKEQVIKRLKQLAQLNHNFHLSFGKQC